MEVLIFTVVMIALSYSCQKDETNTTIVNGQILDSLTNSPIESVSVSLQQEDLFVYPAVLTNTLTDVNGKFYFKFEWNEKHAYSISPVKIGYKHTNSVFLKKGISQNITIKIIKESI